MLYIQKINENNTITKKEQDVIDAMKICWFLRHHLERITLLVHYVDKTLMIMIVITALKLSMITTQKLTIITIIQNIVFIVINMALCLEMVAFMQ